MPGKTLRTILADDEPLGRFALRQLLARHPDLELVGEASDGEEAVAAVSRHAPDLLLLDVQMPELDGFGVVARIGAARMPHTIFVTAFDRFAVRAFEAHALDYLLKPVREERFDAAMARVREALRRDEALALGRKMAALLETRAAPTPVSGAPPPEAARAPEAGPLERLVARAGHRSTVVPVDEIEWIEAQDDCACVHAGGREHLLREPLGELERRLDPRQFLRVHRGALVNVRRIRELRHPTPRSVVVVLESGAHLSVSRRKKAALEHLLGPAR